MNKMLQRVQEDERQVKRASFIKQARAENAALEWGEYVLQPAKMRLGFPIDKTSKQKRPKCGAKC